MNFKKNWLLHSSSAASVHGVHFQDLVHDLQLEPALSEGSSDTIKNIISIVVLCAENNGGILKSMQQVVIQLFELFHQYPACQRHPGPSGREVS